MSKPRRGFTLVELLAVVIILALTFMFVVPKMSSLIKEGNNREVRLIEQKALVSAKKYINDYDTNFLNHFIEVGHTKTVFKQDLIDNGLMTLDEVEQIEDFRGVQVKLLENDKLEYTISRLSSTKDYTNEELLQMINDLKEQVSSNNAFLKSYPVGSIYISTSSTNPGSTYGGTWENIYANYDYIYLDSQVVHPGIQDATIAAGTTEKIVLLGSYTSLFKELEKKHNCSTGYSFKHKWSMQLTTSGDALISLKVNDIVVVGPRQTWSIADFRIIANGDYYNLSGITPTPLTEIDPSYTDLGYIYSLYLENEKSYDVIYSVWDITDHLYAVSDYKIYKWKRIE